TSPHDQDSNLPSTFTVTFTVNSSSAITQAELLLDNNTICTFNSGANNYSCPLTGPLTNGNHILKAKGMDAANHTSERTITIAVGGPIYVPNPTPSPAPSPSP
ncbi:MAG: Ig-like domain-containing protein, partial [Candidatus Woesebacteria bacterium]|nr:Ig-like domain-containing protein [Candidatus Woesebacteria bacterium]